jgi:HSP20 family protein
MHTHTLPTLLDRWLAGVDEGFSPTTAVRAFRPALDLIEHPDRYQVILDIPGVDQKNVSVEFIEGSLQIRGERLVPEIPEGVRTLRQERSAGRFGRSVAFRDDVDVEGIEATFRNGVLSVSVPKSEKAKPRQITVAVH